MEDKIYFARTELSNSDIKLINKSYQHYLDKNDKEDTPSMAFGRALHCFILEPDQFSSRYIIAGDVDRRTTIGKAEWARLESSGLEIISSKEWSELNVLKTNITSHPLAKNMITGATKEEAIFGELEGVKCRAKLDISNKGFLIDLKTTQDASKDGFLKSVVNFEYNQQAAFYSDLYKNVKGESLGFLFIAVERSTGLVACYTLDETLIEAGRAKYKTGIAKYKYHQQNPTAHKGYSDTVETLDCPHWLSMKLANGEL